ncbi:MAG: glycosyl hydrolase [Ignavibacteriae bacterium]|nr:glycosyl hydrolase [Ignavibacteriota bacterium]NOG99937.1 glycosyl hydrolase [Ignavibacteriota bacterium]
MKNFIILFSLLSFLTSFSYAQEKENAKSPLSSSTFSGLKFRSIGPAFASGRISDFAVNPDNINEYYAAVASGGVWKTTNAGTTWEPIFDDQGSYSIGCITMDPNNPHVLWVGSGENNSQRSVGYGDGIYRSSDGGKNWENVGLKNSEHIAKIIVDPRDSKVIYAASQGPLWSAGGERGLYKSTDWGTTWKQVLKISEHTGVTDIVIDPRDPDVIYAASYQRRRHVFTLINGGPESAIYKSTDGGENWNKLKSGLPSVDLGRIGLAISPVNPDYLYAIVEAANDKGGFFRSTNRGATWEKRNSMIARSPQYYMEIYCDPVNVDKVYSLDTWTKITKDGGKTFTRLGNKHRHVDDHAIWINPKNNNHILIGGDGGIYETFDGAKNWHFKNNLPVTQYYKVATDNSEPFYYVYGGTQDNNTHGGPSRTINANGIMNSDWFVTLGGDGFETQIDPLDPNTVYSQYQYGGLVRYDRKSGERISIVPVEGKGEEAYRFNWDSPLLISPHKNTRLYFCANKVFKSEDRGNSWEIISGDLTRQLDRNKIPVMGKFWSVDAVSKNASTSQYGNIVAFSESPVKEGLLYAGTDDGLIQVSKDGGTSWTKYESFPDVPETTYVNMLFASQFVENTVYAVFNNHKRGDFKPYILKSEDAGNSWKSISSNLPERGSVYAIAEDHINPKLLFAGTEFGVFFTIDAGKKWIQLKGGLPTIAVRDIEIQKRENDLVLATFGRGFYILDDYSSLRNVSEKEFDAQAIIFPVKDALMYIEAKPMGGSGKASRGESFYTAPNPEFGATFTYYLKNSIKTKADLRRQKEKELIKKEKPVTFPSYQKLDEEFNEEDPYLLFTITDDAGEVVRRLRANASKGVNRITWDLRYHTSNPPAKGIDKFDNKGSGMPTLPGNYSVSMAKVVNGKVTQLTEPVEFRTVLLNNSKIPDADRRSLYKFHKQLASLNRAVKGAQKFIDELEDRVSKIRLALKRTPEADEQMFADAQKIKIKLNEIDRQLSGDKTLSKLKVTAPPSIGGRISDITWGLWNTSSAPTQTQIESYKITAEEFKPLLNDLKIIVENDLKNLESKMESIGAPWTPGRIPAWDEN